MVRTFLSLLVGALVLGVATLPSSAAAAPDRAGAATQPVTLGYYGGATVRYYDFGPIKLKPGNKLAPIWSVTNGTAGQRNVIDTVPGKADYSPLWLVNKVTWVAGKTPRTLTSADAVMNAAAAGQVTITPTATVVNCPVLGFGQKRIAGFSGGHVIHYYDLGPVKVAPGNDVVPLYAVTNGVAGQHNVTGETIPKGQTAYPPLWAITNVTWKPGVRPRLLTSYAAIEKAERADQLTLTKTTLVVNCPLV